MIYKIIYKNGKGKDIIRILICDDDTSISKYILEQIDYELYNMKLDAVKLIFSNGQDLLDYFKHNTADLLFLDIELEAMNGIAIAQQLNRINPALRIVYVTGHIEYADDICLSRFENILIKPINLDKLRFVIRSVMKEIELQTDFIQLKIGSTPMSLDARKIMYIESDRRKIVLHCTDSTIQYYYKISEIFQMLPDFFIQCHKSYIVNMDYIQNIHGNDIQLKFGTYIPIAQKRIKTFKQKYADYLGV